VQLIITHGPLKSQHWWKFVVLNPSIVALYQHFSSLPDENYVKPQVHVKPKNDKIK